jgi:hypothetical protein
MSMAGIDHRMVWRRARPGRAALVLPPAGGDWIPLVKGALCSLSLTWGGAADILLPARADGTLPPEFRYLLGEYDPDYIAAYQAAPGERADARPRPAQPASDAPAGVPVEPRTQAAAELARSWCSPYPPAGGSLPVASVSVAIGSPLVPLSAFRSLLDRPLDLDLSGLDPAFELMVRMRTGSLEGALLPYRARMRRPAVTGDDMLALAELACDGEARHPPALHSKAAHMRPLGGNGSHGGGGDRLSPFARTAHGTEWTRTGLLTTWVVVIGDTCEDFCFALACDRFFMGATWLPARLVSDPLLAGGLASLRSRARRYPGLGFRAVFTSLSLDLAAVDEARQAVLAADAAAADKCSAVVAPSSLEFRWPKRLADPASRHLGESSSCYRDADGALNLATALATPVPDAVREADVSDVAWEVDVTVDGEQPLPRTALAPDALLSGASRQEGIGVRASTQGLVYQSHSPMARRILRLDLHDGLVRPALRLPGAAETVRRLAGAAGYEVRPSQTGRLNQALIQMWGGLEAAAADLSGQARSLLDALTPSPGIKDGPRENSLVVNRLPYVRAEDARALLGLDEAGTRRELDRLLRLGVLRRGLILRCSRCHWLDWYPIDRIGQRFTCGRCDHGSLLEQDRWHLPVLEPAWYYDLDHAIREALRLDGHVPVLALDRLRAENPQGFSYTTDFEVIRNGGSHPPEIDFAVIADGWLILGEAKKNDRLAGDRHEEKRKIDRLATVARDLTADYVCLATAAAQWNPGTVTLADGALAVLGIERTYVTALGPGTPG